MDEIARESLVLTKLLRRNHNQHGHTKLYQHLKKLKNKLLFYNAINDFNEVMNKSLNVASKNSKLSILELNMLFDCINDLSRVIAVTVDSIREVVLCNELVKQQLDQLIFIPLNTIFTALLGKIMTLLLRFYDVYVKNKDILVSYLRHITLTQLRYKELIEKSLVSDGAAEFRKSIYASSNTRIDQLENIMDILLPRTTLLMNEGNGQPDSGCSNAERDEATHNSDDDGNNDDNGDNDSDDGGKYKVVLLDDSAQRKRKSSDLVSKKKKKKKKKEKKEHDSTGIDAIFSGF